MRSEQCVLLDYDIPTKSEFANPSGRLRRHGFRSTLSCWIMPEHQLGRISDILEDMTLNGIRWRVYRFDKNETENLKARCREVVAHDLQTAHTNMIETIADAKEAFDSAVAAAQPNDGLTELVMSDLGRKRYNRIKGAIKRAAEYLNDAIEAATLFDEQGNLADVFEATKLAIAAQTAAFEAEVDATGYHRPSSGTRQKSATDTVWGHHVYRLLYWMGANGWDRERANRALAALNVSTIDGSVRRFLRMGRRNEAPRMLIELTDEQIERLNSAAGAAQTVGAA